MTALDCASEGAWLHHRARGWGGIGAGTEEGHGRADVSQTGLLRLKVERSE